MPRPTLLVAEPLDFSPQAKAILQARADVTFEQVGEHGLREGFARYDAVWIRLAHRIDAAMLGEKPRCRVLACPVTGLDHIDLEACAARKIQVLSLKGETEFLKRVRATAELTLGLALALIRHIPDAATSVKAGHWTRDAFRGQELFEKTAGVIGMGRLGTIVAGYYRALGMRVIGFDPHGGFPEGVEQVGSLEALLRASDLLSVHVSYSPSTHHLLDAAAFEAVKPGAWLVNTSRGDVVDEAAMLEALRGGRLAAAGLDVLSGEPHVDASHPVVQYARTHSNCLVVPHIGGNTEESFVKTEVFLAGKVIEALR